MERKEQEQYLEKLLVEKLLEWCNGTYSQQFDREEWEELCRELKELQADLKEEDLGDF